MVVSSGFHTTAFVLGSWPSSCATTLPEILCQMKMLPTSACQSWGVSATSRNLTFTPAKSKALVGTTKGAADQAIPASIALILLNDGLGQEVDESGLPVLSADEQVM